MVVKIVKVFNHQVHEFTNNKGVKQSFATRGFVLESASGLFYAEAVGSLADATTQLTLSEGMVVCVSVSLKCRSYKTQSGDERYMNDVELTNLFVL